MPACRRNFKGALCLVLTLNITKIKFIINNFGVIERTVCRLNQFFTGKMLQNLDNISRRQNIYALNNGRLACVAIRNKHRAYSALARLNNHRQYTGSLAKFSVK